MRWHPLSQAQYLETAYLLPGYILSSQGDRMAMANAVEGRFPFLDHRVVEMAAKIPPRLKLHGLTEKHILREAARGLVPPTMAKRPKQPYRAPDSASFFGAGAPALCGDGCSPARRSRPPGSSSGRPWRSSPRRRAPGASSGFRDNVALTGILSTQLWREAFVPERRNDGIQNLPARRVA